MQKQLIKRGKIVVLPSLQVSVLITSIQPNSQLGPVWFCPSWSVVTTLSMGEEPTFVSFNIFFTHFEFSPNSVTCMQCPVFAGVHCSLPLLASSSLCILHSSFFCHLLPLPDLTVLPCLLNSLLFKIIIIIILLLFTEFSSHCTEVFHSPIKLTC